MSLLQLQAVLLEFVHAACHSLLYTSKIYPKESFDKKQLPSCPFQIYFSRNKQVNEYLDEFIEALKPQFDKVARIHFAVLQKDETEGCDCDAWKTKEIFTFRIDYYSLDKPNHKLADITKIEKEFTHFFKKILVHNPGREEEDEEDLTFRLYVEFKDDIDNLSVNQSFIEDDKRKVQVNSEERVEKCLRSLDCELLRFHLLQQSIV